MQCVAAIKVATKKCWHTNVLWHNFPNPFPKELISELLRLAIAIRRQSNAVLRFGVRWIIASDLRSGAVISKLKTHFLYGKIGDLALTTANHDFGVLRTKGHQGAMSRP